MANVSDGVYRITLFDRPAFLGESLRDTLALVGKAEALSWEIRRADGSDQYTLRVAGTDRFVGYSSDSPLPMAMVVLGPHQRRWALRGGPAEDTVMIAAAGTDLTFGLAPVMVYPPLLALSPPYDRDLPWTLEPA